MAWKYRKVKESENTKRIRNVNDGVFRKFFTLFSKKKILYKCTIKKIRRVTYKENNFCPLRLATTWSDRWNPKIWQVLPARSIEHLVKRWQTWSNGRMMRSWEKQTKNQGEKKKTLCGCYFVHCEFYVKSPHWHRISAIISVRLIASPMVGPD